MEAVRHFIGVIRPISYIRFRARSGIRETVAQAIERGRLIRQKLGIAATVLTGRTTRPTK